MVVLKFFLCCFYSKSQKRISKKQIGPSTLNRYYRSHLTDVMMTQISLQDRPHTLYVGHHPTFVKNLDWSQQELKINSLSLFLQVLNVIQFHFHVLNYYSSRHLSFSDISIRSERSENQAGETEDGLSVNRTMQRLHFVPGRWWEHAQVHSQNSVRGSRRAWPSLLQSRRQTLYLLPRIPFGQLLIRSAFFILTSHNSLYTELHVTRPD